MSLRKEIKQLVEEARKAGARIEDRGNKWFVYCPDGVTIVTIHKTPSHLSSIRHSRADLRRGGVDV